MKLSRHAVTLVAALMLSTIAPKVFAQVRIAVVDLQRALNETEDGRRAKAQLKRLFKRRQQELDKQQADLKLLKEQIEAQVKAGVKADSPGMRERMEAYQKAFVELQTTYVEYQRELATKEGELTKQILERMERILRRIGQAEGYTMIFERNEAGVMWAPTNLDLTDSVIQRYNAGEGREGEAAGGGGGAPTPPAGAGGSKTKATKRPAGGGGGGGGAAQ